MRTPLDFGAYWEWTSPFIFVNQNYPRRPPTRNYPRQKPEHVDSIKHVPSMGIAREARVFVYIILVVRADISRI